MLKLIALYSKPADPAAFDQAYFGTHIPLVNKIPGLVRAEVSRITGALRGETELYLISTLYFQDRATFDAAMQSPENTQAGKNLMGFARGLVTFLTAEDAS